MVTFCKRCVYPSVAVNLELDDEGICSSCRTFEEIYSLDSEVWKEREKKLVQIIETERSKNPGREYDCMIPVSGGKDSYFQAHKIKSYGFKPLLVTYHGNNFLPEGEENLQNMSRELNCDHYIFRPSEETLIKLNVAAFKMMGDMNWHAHAGIRIIAAKSAVQFNVPIFIWGEVAWDISGMFSHMDFVEYNKRVVLEHDMRGYTKESFYNKENIKPEEVSWWTLPSDEDFQKFKLRGLFLGNFIKWDPYKQTEEVRKHYNWQEARQPFERTYRTISNLDDMHENGIHDYLKYVKFGYGRCSDHASKDIRMGYISRNQAIDYVKKYDHVKPYNDLNRWLKYTNMDETEFDEISNKFRDPRAWEISDGKWKKKFELK